MNRISLSSRTGRVLASAALVGAILVPGAITAYAETTDNASRATTTTTSARSAESLTTYRQNTAQLPVLQQGSRGAAVAAAQDLLTAAGRPVVADGGFGPATAAAVRDFQRAQGLTADGVVGSKTWAVLAVTVRPGAQGPAVKAVQRQLAEKGVGVAVDGEFGPATTSAVKRFQQKHGLSADGVVGPRTWAALLGGSPVARPDNPSGNVPGDVSALRKRIVSGARSQIGVSERTNGCRVYLKSCRTTPWCAAFTSWAWRQAGVPKASVPTTLVARGVGLWGKERGLFHTSNPKPGDVVVWGTPAQKTGGHVGIVVAVHADGRIDTVEGNSSNKVKFRQGIDPRTNVTRGHKISGYVSPPGA
ncbi:peptidoglycan-binding protein [Streptomyces sp. NPDC000410]|uniref:peptidoglycan-binding protein n=1 Tax=Streptomyces sp. NPDC000410 TaxID=3154254 RepID=UPI00331F719C